MNRGRRHRTVSKLQLHAASLGIALGLAFTAVDARAQSAEEIARALQDPLATIAALMTDNTINFNSGDPETTGYNFQLQPVYAVPFETFNFIPRGIIPIIGAPGSADFPNLGPPQPPGEGVTWGLGDIILQTFFNPKSKSAWKWGAGPQFSLQTRTDSAVAGPGWGAGVGVVLVGDIGRVSIAYLMNQHWGFDGEFSVLSMQPMIFWNLPSPEGFTINYNNTIALDWKGTEGKWTVPLGAGVSQAFVLGGGHGLDIGLGLYGLVARPEGGPNWQLKIYLTWLIPR